MKKVFTTLVIGIHFLPVFCQIIDNRLDIYAGYNTGNYSGKEILSDNSYISPSLFAGYKNLNGWSAKAMYKLGVVTSAGLGLDYSKADGWYSENYDDYNGSDITQYSVSAVLQLHSRYSETGVFNRLAFYIEVAPGFGSSSLRLNRSLFDIQPVIPEFSLPLESNDYYFFIKGSAGVEFTVNNIFGLYINYSVQEAWTTSLLYNDKNALCSNLGFGVFVRFLKDKYYMF